MAFGVAGAIGSIASGLIGASSAKKAATKAYKRSIMAYRNRYQWQTEDMIKAGLNPILSAYTGAGNAPSAPVADTSDLAQGVRGASAAGIAGLQAKAGIVNTNANTAKTIADASLTAEREMTEKANQFEANERALLAGQQRKELELKQPGTVSKMDSEIAQNNAAAALHSARAANERANKPRVEFYSSPLGLGIENAGRVVGSAKSLLNFR